MTPWPAGQPIESAPRDWSGWVSWNDGIAVFADFAMQRDGRWFVYDGTGDIEVSPTHFTFGDMPLPPLPGSEG